LIDDFGMGFEIERVSFLNFRYTIHFKGFREITIKSVVPGGRYLTRNGAMKMMERHLYEHRVTC
jgi:hypothetical protein